MYLLTKEIEINDSDFMDAISELSPIQQINMAASIMNEVEKGGFVKNLEPQQKEVIIDYIDRLRKLFA